MENIQDTYPLQLVHLDYLTTERTEGGKDVHVLIITDHFLRYAQALVTSSHAVMCTTQGVCGCFVVYYGLPESIISDQVEILTVTLFQNCASWQKFQSCILVWTIHRQMDNVNSLIVH